MSTSSPNPGSGQQPEPLTDPTEPTPAPTFAEQEPAVAALAAMAEAFPHLPPALIQMPHVYPGRLEISLHGAAADWEAWREALRLPAEAVELHHFKGSSWLAVSGSWGGASVKLTGHVIPPVEPRPSGQLLAPTGGAR